MTQAQYALPNQALPEAVAALAQSDKRLKPWIAKIGALAVPKRQSFELVDALARSILFQQLHGKAAETIVKRLEALASESVFSAGTLARLSEAEYRSVGVSANKAKALHSLADSAFSGRLPGPRQLQKLDNAALIEAISSVRGVGAWTVQMLLLFRLGRTDVWPVDDFGVRKGVQIAHKLAEMPTPKELQLMAQKHWHPHYSLAALYFWRIADLSKLDSVAQAKSKAKSQLESADKSKAKPVASVKSPVKLTKAAAKSVAKTVLKPVAKIMRPPKKSASKTTS
jgi:DNA-3-methyladenine glycosylase II